MIKKFFTKLANLPKDLLLHYFYGSLIALPLTIVFGWYSVFFVFCIASTKEIIDYIIADAVNKRIEFKRAMFDIIATVLPALFFNL